MPDPDKPENWAFQVGSSWLGQRNASLGNEQRVEMVKMAAVQLSEPFRSATLWMPKDTVVDTDPISYWVPIPIETHQGRITLCGDAAHPLPPRKFTKGNRFPKVGPEADRKQIVGKVSNIASLTLRTSWPQW